jgi:hypothetical protein
MPTKGCNGFLVPALRGSAPFFRPAAPVRRSAQVTLDRATCVSGLLKPSGEAVYEPAVSKVQLTLNVSI